MPELCTHEIHLIFTTILQGESGVSCILYTKSVMLWGTEQLDQACKWERRDLNWNVLLENSGQLTVATFCLPTPTVRGSQHLFLSYTHASQAHRAASTEDIPGPDPHLEREFWKRYSKKCFEQKDIVRSNTVPSKGGSLRSFTYTQMCKISVVFKASVTLLYVHTSMCPWSSSKLSRNQLFTLNDVVKLALPPQLGYFKCKLLAYGSR